MDNAEGLVAYFGKGNSNIHDCPRLIQKVHESAEGWIELATSGDVALLAFAEEFDTFNVADMKRSGFQAEAEMPTLTLRITLKSITLPNL
jgi:hypothetical protein